MFASWDWEVTGPTGIQMLLVDLCSPCSWRDLFATGEKRRPSPASLDLTTGNRFKVYHS